MPERAVTHVLKNSEDDITFLCEPSASWSPRPTRDVIEDIESGSHHYRVVWPGRSDTPIQVVNGPTGKYLRTQGDTTESNNLDELPLCAGWGLPHFLSDYPKATVNAWSQNSQGVTHDASNWFFTRTDRLFKFPVSEDLAGPTFGFPSVPIPKSLKQLGYNHFGDPDFASGHILVPLDGDNGLPAIAVFSPDDLSLVTTTEIPHPQWSKAGWLAVDSGNETIFSSPSLVDENNPIGIFSYDATQLSIGVLSLAHVGNLVPRDPSGQAVTLKHMQGGVFGEDGRLYLTNGFPELGSSQSGIHVLDATAGIRLARSSVSRMPFLFKFDPGFFDREEPEGITWWNLDGRSVSGIEGQLHVMLRDNSFAEISDHRLIFKHYRVGHT